MRSEMLAAPSAMAIGMNGARPRPSPTGNPTGIPGEMGGGVDPIDAYEEVVSGMLSGTGEPNIGECTTMRSPGNTSARFRPRS